MKVKEESEKVGLKLNIQKTKIMASGPITSWQIDGETVQTVANFIFLGSEITAGGDGSHEIKRCLLLRRNVMTCQGASVRNPAHDKVMRKEADIRKVMIRLQGSPWNFLSIPPPQK